MTLDESVTAGTVVEENTLLLQSPTAAGEPEPGTATPGDRVRKRLAVCLFLHIVGVAIVLQVYPRVSFEWS